MDFRANKTLTGGLSLQTLETYRFFIENADIQFDGKNFELYFEESSFDCFIERLTESGAELGHPVKKHLWGQRAVRFYGPDRNIIEVGRSLLQYAAGFWTEA